MLIQKSLETYWRYHVPFDSVVKFQSLAQFLVDHFSQPNHVDSCTPFEQVCFIRLIFYYPFHHGIKLTSHQIKMRYTVILWKLRAMHNSRFMFSLHKKNAWSLWDSPYRWTSGTKLWTQPCKVDIACRDRL